MSYLSLGSQDAHPDGREQNQPLLDDYTEDDEFVEDAKRRVNRKRIKKKCIFALLLTGFVVVAGCIVIVPIVISWNRSHNNDRVRPTSNSVLGRYQHAAVASDVTQCSQIGKSILLKKGSAVDAAIASLFCMGLTDPQSMGIGGGFLMTVYNRTDQSVVVIDARETAPGAANKSMFEGRPELASRGPLSVAVPGEVRGYYTAHELYGRLPWSEVVAPSIDMATNGFVVPKSLGEALQQDKDNILNSTYLSKAYVNPATGKLYKTGEIMKCPSLAGTLQMISADPLSFYTGPLMKDVVADIRGPGGIITEEDMKNYTVKVREPSVTTLRSGLRVFAPPPPGSGPVLEFILQILDGYLLTPDSLSGDSSLRTYHRMIEAFKFAYAKRTYLGDEDFVDVAKLVANLTSREYADEIRKLIWDNTTHSTDYYGAVWDGNVKTGTAHLSVVAENGDAVSVTSTVNARFGSKVMGEKTGIVFNNEMDDFSTPNLTNIFGLRPSPANFIQPGKRPLSSMCPAIVLDKKGQVTMAVGAAGGSRITTTTAMVMSYLLWFGDNIKQAIDELRLHHQLLPATAYFEEGFPEKLVSGLESLRHNMTSQMIGKSIVQGISRTGNGQLEANSDYRKGGSPAGY